MGIKLKVEGAHAERSTRDFLQQLISAAPLAYLNQLLKKGKVLRSGQPLSGEDLLRAGELVELPDSGRLRELIALSDRRPAPPVVLFETDEILIADKPAGLAVHASDGHETSNLTALLQERAGQAGAKFRISPVQRLDLDTSGACLFGKGRKALGELGQLLMDHQLSKTYLALVSGEYRGPAELESAVRAKGKLKESRCRVTLLSGNKDASLLEIALLTGRQHQIRQQLAQQGYPLFGDRRYQGPCPAGLPRIFLHSHELSFHSPFGGDMIAVTAELPEDLRGFLAQLNLVLAD